MGWSILSSPGDGHCLLHSFVSSWNNQSHQLDRLDIEKVKAQVFIEAISHPDRYVQFLQSSNRKTFFSGLRSYLIDKQYNLDFGDIVPLIIANAFHVNLEIFNEVNFNRFENVVVSSEIASDFCLKIHRKGDHYNGLVISNLKKVTKTCHHVNVIEKLINRYTVGELQDLRPSNNSIPRPLRKRIFSLHLWKPKKGLRSIPYSLSITSRNGIDYSETCHSFKVKDIPVHITSRNNVRNTRFKHDSRSDVLINVPIRSWGFPTFLNSNLRSLVNKIDELVDVLNSNAVDIACITETWLSDNVPTSVCNIDGYCMERIDRQERSGGGVACYIRTDLSYTRNKDLEKAELECMWISARPKSLPREISQVLVGVVYHPPGSDDRIMCDHIVNTIDEVSRKHPHTAVVILGDFNRMKDFALKSFPLKQVVKSGTRADALLDLIYTNIDNYYEVPRVFAPVGLSDHNIVIFEPKPFCKIVRNNCFREVYRRQISNNNLSILASLIRNISWTDLYRMNSCQEMVDCFYSRLSSVINECLPLKKVRIFCNEKPWVTERFRDLIRKRQVAFYQKNFSLYRMFRNKVNRMARTLRKNYYQSQISQLSKSNPRNWWKKTKEIIGVKDKANQFSSLIDGVSNGNTKGLVRQINNFFGSVCDDLAPVQNEPTSLFGECQVEDKFIISVAMVENRLKKINVSKAAGPDDIPSFILKDFAKCLAPPICAIFNASIREGFVPRIWKSANVVPIPKVFPPQCIENDLRPISLTSVVMKQLESFIGCWLLDTFETKLDPQQYGGLKGRSTTQALLRLINNWHEAAEKNCRSHIVFLDYKKAFDHVDHNILLRKCENLGVPTILLNWLRSFLSERQQRVILSNEVSEWLELKGSVPQGSWLGPLLFVVLIDELRPQNCDCVKYMDDTTLSVSVPKNQDSSLQSVVDYVSEWSNINNMVINPKKSKEMIISFAKKEKDIGSIVVKGELVSRVNSFKILGVTVSDDLTWSEHISIISKKVNSRIYYLKLLRRAGVSLSQLKLFYTSVIRPVLEYACPVWFTSLSNSDKIVIERLERRSLKIIVPHMSYEEVVEMFRLTPILDRMLGFCAQTFRKIENPNHPLSDILENRHPVDYNIRSSRKFHIPKIRTNRYKKSFFPHGLINFQ